MADWGSMGCVIAQTRGQTFPTLGQAFKTLDRAFSLLLNRQKFGRVFQKLS